MVMISTGMGSTLPPDWKRWLSLAAYYPHRRRPSARQGADQNRGPRRLCGQEHCAPHPGVLCRDRRPANCQVCPAGRSGACQAAEASVNRGSAIRQHSGDAEQEYFADGISEDIITDPRRSPGCSSSLAIRASRTRARASISAPWGASWRNSVLEGSIRRAGNRVRITAQLIDAGWEHLWAERYDRDLTDIFVLQDKVTRRSSRRSR